MVEQVSSSLSPSQKVLAGSLLTLDICAPHSSSSLPEVLTP